MTEERKVKCEVREGELLIESVDLHETAPGLLYVYIDTRTKYPVVSGIGGNSELYLSVGRRFEGNECGSEGEPTIVNIEGIPESWRMWADTGRYSVEVFWVDPGLFEPKQCERLWERSE